MKIYVMSRTKNGNCLKPKVSTSYKDLSTEMNAEYDKILKDAGSLGAGYLMNNGLLIAYNGAIKYTWRIDEIKL